MSFSNIFNAYLSSVRSSVGKSSDSGDHDLPGGHVSRGSIAGDSISIIFDLAVPDTADQRMVIAQPQSSNFPDTTRGSPYLSDNMGPVFQISGTRYDNVMSDMGD